MAASAKTRICNMALSHLGAGLELSNVDSERSNEAAACRMFYESARRLTLKAFPWPFATKIAALALITEQPNTEWAYSYRYPADCLEHRRILSGIRNDTRSTRVPSKLANDETGLVIFTDQENAFSEYTIDEQNNNLFPEDFMMALSYRLATMIAARVTGGDPFKMGDRAMQNFVLQMSQAEATNANEEQPDVEPDSELILSREGIPSSCRTNFIR